MQSGIVSILSRLVHYLGCSGLHLKIAEKWSFVHGRTNPWFASSMGVPGSRNSEQGDLVGATGQHIGHR